MRYVADVASDGLFYDPVGSSLRDVALRGMRLLSVIRSISHVLVCVNLLADSHLAAVGQCLPKLSEQLPNPCTYFAAMWKVELPHVPSSDFMRWYMSRSACSCLVLEACCKLCNNLLEHLQIPKLRLAA